MPIREFHDLNAPIASAIDDREYAIPDINFYSTFAVQNHLSTPRLMRALSGNSNTMKPYATLKPMTNCCIHQQQCLPVYQQSPIILSSKENIPPIEASCGNSLMISTNRILDNKHPSIKELNSDDLIFIENVGHGLFGSIYLAQIKIMKNDNKVETQTVIVKSLNDNVDVNNR